MLEFIRSKAQGWFAWLIVIMITIPFALWGIHQYFSGSNDSAVATVNGQEISKAQLEQAYQAQRQRLQQMLGANFNPDMFPEAEMKARVLESLIQQELLVQAASDSGLRIGDQQLNELIRDVPAFQTNGKFSPELYARIANSQGLSVSGFDARIRRQLVTQQLQAAVLGSEFVTNAESSALMKLRKQTRDVGYLTVPAQRYEKDVTITDDEISSYYKENTARFTIPEKVSINYIELDAANLAKDIQVSEDEIKQRYDSQEMNYRIPEQRKARHILILVPKSADEKSVAAAKKKIEEIRARINKGESFAKLAEEYSQDPGSAKQGGDLGFFGRGVMDPAFEKATFALKKGEVSEPVRSQFGFHLIQLEDVRGGGVRPLAEVHDQIANEIRQDQAEQRYYDLAGKLGNLAFEHPEGLEEASRQLNLPILHSEPFSRKDGKGLTADPKVVTAAFSDQVLNGGGNSDALEIGDKHLVVLRIRDHIPEKVQPLDEVKPQIQATLRKQKGTARAEEVADSLLTRLSKGENPTLLAKEIGSEWHRDDKLTRTAKELPQAVVTQAFRMPRPSGSTPAAAKVALPGGDQAVIALFGVTSPATIEESDRKIAERQLQQSDAEADFNDLVNALKAKAKITH